MLGKEGDGPMYVSSISPGGLAEAAGVRVGDTVVTIAGVTPSSTSHGTTLLKKSAGNVEVCTPHNLGEL